MRPLGTEASPIEDPLSYPGRTPRDSAVLTPDGVGGIRVRHDRPLASAVVDGAAGGGTLADLLARCGADGMDERRAVLCIGSNASPAQLRHKFAAAEVAVTTPMIRIEVRGMVPGVSAHISRPGYLPASPVIAPRERAELFVIWLDRSQLGAMDATEGTYARRVLRLDGADGGPVRVHGPVPEWGRTCDLYASERGVLVADGEPVRLRQQRALQAVLRDRVPGVADLMGADPATWIARASDLRTRERVRQSLEAEGMVRPQPYFEALPHADDPWLSARR